MWICNACQYHFEWIEGFGSLGFYPGRDPPSERGQKAYPNPATGPVRCPRCGNANIVEQAVGLVAEAEG